MFDFVRSVLTAGDFANHNFRVSERPRPGSFSA